MSEEEKRLVEVYGFPNYMIDEDGNIFNRKTRRQLKNFVSSGGYFMVGLYIDGERFNRFVHRLVYGSFVEKIPEGLQIDHKDQNKLNNYIYNLRLATPQQNSTNTKARNKLKEKCIYEYKNGYRVLITRNGKNVVDRCFPEDKLEDAKKFRDEMMRNFDPFSDSYEEIEQPKKISNTKEKNIHLRKYCYEVKIMRNKITTTKYFPKTPEGFQRAIEFRDQELLKF